MKKGVVITIVVVLALGVIALIGDNYSLTGGATSSPSLEGRDGTTCTDDDGNRIVSKGRSAAIYVKSTTQWKYQDSEVSKTDTCISEVIIEEHNCQLVNTRAEIVSTRYNCPRGYTCSVGACVKE